MKLKMSNYLENLELLEPMASTRCMDTARYSGMAMTRMTNLTVLALALGGLLSSANAQQTGTPPPATVSPQYQTTSPGGKIQLYSLPTGSTAPPTAPAERPMAETPPSATPVEPPMMSIPSSRPNPYGAPEPISQAQYQSPSPYADDVASSDWSPPGGSIKIQDYRGIRFASGGVGEGERAELSALSNQFNLRLLFAMQGSGDYVADIRISILDSRGEAVLSAESNGPWFLAALPAGTYTVEVSLPDQLQRQTVQIGGSRQSQLNFYWR